MTLQIVVNHEPQPLKREYVEIGGLCPECNSKEIYTESGEYFCGDCHKPRKAIEK